ncbi:hypothetical protein QFZ82_005122 [Streptomyces sp. V4I23]|uniref:hypothetical protein n=1 Tax=Streptomyces sp. V4I23 TaxID=3042282 RepID=UPI0027898655|nr:hypothetical protein [Streptomyces sp. V4I23]MDQ1010637.1 hypothetical protein [Streptomyces sp. V4I23]
MPARPKFRAQFRVPARPPVRDTAPPSVPRRGRRRIPNPAAAPGRVAPLPVPAPRPAADAVSDVVRWAAFTCLLVPVVLVVYGTSVGGAAAAALGLTAMTAACQVLLRHSEREAAHARARSGAPQAGRRVRCPEGTRRGTHRGPVSTPGN